MAGKHYSDYAQAKDKREHGNRMKSYEHGEDHNVAKAQAEGSGSAGEGGKLITPDLMALGFEASQMHIPEVANDPCASSVKGSWDYGFDKKNSYGDGEEGEEAYD
jgi:hypothetical protein